VQGIKLEQFIFDPFPLAERPALVEVRRSEEFAPVKNASGVGKSDTPATARAMLMALHRKWVEDAGGKVDGGPGAGLEVSALASFAGEGLAERCAGEKFACNVTIE
jgi:UDP-N-acetylglucosamine/UDP-N-acetylgalactosamine diphosphorylase